MQRNIFQPWETGVKHPDSKKAKKEQMIERRRARKNKRDRVQMQAGA